MKIAYVYDAVYPWEKGGGQKRVWEIARRLAADHDVHLYGMHYWEGPRIMERDGITYHGVCDPKDLYAKGRRSIYQALYFAAHVARPILRERFDLIDCQAWPLFPIFATKAHEVVRRSRLVVTWFEVWDDYWYEYLGYKGVAGKTVERLTVRLPTEIITLSAYLKDRLRSIGRTDDVSVVHNGVDYEGLQGVAEADTRWDVIYVGSLLAHKNVDLLLEAVAKASAVLDRDLTCGIIGDGPERETLDAHASEIGVDDQVSFLGFIEDDEDVIANLKTATVFVLPSVREGFPNTILEANACGLPSIVVDHEDNGSTAVVKDGETGFITPVAADAIADRIVQVVSEPATRERLSEGARRFGEAHDWDVIVDQLEAVYERVQAR